MALKDLFNEAKSQYLAATSLDELTGNIESADYIKFYLENKQRFVPLVDYSIESNFARFGSAEKYYYDSINWIADTYPYDGSRKEKVLWELSSSHLDLYLFDNGYPRTTGYAVFTTASLTATDTSEGYGAAGTASYEYIFVNGGPHGGTGKAVYLDPDTGKAKYRKNANIWDTSENRECNLKIGGTDGNTVEFWLKKAEFDPDATKKEVIFDIHTTSSISSSADYGRLRIEMSGHGAGTNTTSPFYVTYMSGTTGISNQNIGASLTTSSIADDSWHHYAFRFKNTGSNIVTDLFVDGAHNHRVTTGTTVDYVSGTIVGTIGALATYPSGAAGPPQANKGWGKLSGSVDEFRYWKVWRTSEQIQTRWFDQVGGGTNTDDANTDLGVYFKFNEGITLTASTDENVLDYSGRVSNGTWTGYSADYSRSTGSAINDSDITSFSGSEYRDPIVYKHHPDFQSFLTDKRKTGKEYDYTNPSNMYYGMPTWIIEEHDANNPDNAGIIDNSFWNLTQIISSYFDNAANQIKTLPSLAQPDYPSGSMKPIPFMDRILESKGFISPEVFSALDALEALENRDDNSLYTQKIYDIKNIIYRNIYNNLTYIYKSKGTEKSFRNLVRCFGIDDEIYKFNMYSNNVDFVLRDNYRSISERYRLVNFNTINNSDGVVYQYSSSANPNSVTFISASNVYDTAQEGAGLPFSVEANIIFPNRVEQGDYNTLRRFDTSTRNAYPLTLTASLFGMHTADDTAPEDTTWALRDYANFVVKAVKSETFSNKARFVLTGTADGFIPELTSSVFDDVYKDKNWQFLVSLYPIGYPNANQVSGTAENDYVVEFAGIHNILDVTINEFSVTGTISSGSAIKFLTSPKRAFVGAHRTNFTGSLITKSDVKFNNLRVWQNKLSSNDLKMHAKNPKNYGISNPEQNAYLFNTSVDKTFVPNKETLLLHWNFDNVTGSDASGEFLVEDLTSGSTSQLSRYGWLSNLNKQQHTGKAYEFAASSTDVYVIDEITTAKSNLPEVIDSNDTVTVMQNDDIYFTRDKRPTFFDLHIEKSPYQNISEEMMKFMATVTDFNQLIGHSVDRYRHEYKSLALLRSLFFQRIKNVPDVDKYIEYFKWFDVAISAMIRQIAPMSSGLTDRPLKNIIESHILERNKYQSKFPSYEFKQSDPEGSLLGIKEMLYDWKAGHAPLSEEQSDNCLWWKDRAERDDAETTSDDDDVDSNRNTYLTVLNNQNSASAPNLSGSSGTYEGSTYAIRRFARPYKISSDLRKQIHGGGNSYANKKVGFWDSIRKRPAPAGSSAGATISIEPDESDLEDFKNCDDNSALRQGKRKYSFSVQTSIDDKDFTTEDKFKGDLIFPFSFYSSSINDDASRGDLSDFQANLDITNLHHDSYGPFKDVPMQGPFTEKYVGGRPYRHVFTNFTPDNEEPDSSTERLEGWSLSAEAGVLDLTTPSSPKSVYFRDGIAKRPVNIANIQQLTSAADTEDQYIHPVDVTNIGNYTKGYEIVMTNGRSMNNRYLAESDGDLPTTSADNTFVSGALDFALPRRDLTGSNSFIIVNRFSAPGDPSTMAEGMLDVAAAEYSVYNALPWRNLSVRQPLDELYSDHSKQFGYFSDAFNSASYVLAGITYPGTSGSVTADNYDGNPASASFHKVNRNTRKQPKYSNEFTGDAGTVEIANSHDSWFVQHPIPQTDVQYAWITASIVYGYTGSALYGYEKPNFANASLASTDLIFATSSDFGSIISKASSVVFTYNRGFGTFEAYAGAYNNTYVPTDFAGINSNIYEPITSSDNVLGYPTLVATDIGGGWDEVRVNYINPTFCGGNSNGENVGTGGYAWYLNKGLAAVLNAILLHRQGPYGAANWKLYKKDNHPIVRAHRQENRLSYLEPTLEYDPEANVTLKTRNIVSVIEPPITGKYKQLVHKVLVKEDPTTDVVQSTTINHSYGNNVNFFTDHTSDGINLDNILHPKGDVGPQTLDAINYYLYSGQLQEAFNPIEELESLIINETIFPKEQYTYLSKTRQRENYVNDFWRDSRQTRATRGLSVLNPFIDPVDGGTFTENVITLYGLNVTASIWPLDARLDFETASPGRIKQNECEVGVGLICAVVSGTIDQAGILQNGAVPYALFPTYTGDVKLATAATLLPQYNRRIAGVISTDSNHEYKFGDTLWEAADQSGIKPFYDTYADYVDEIKRTGKDHGLLPEFRMSEHMDFYLNQKGGNFLADNTASFTLTGSNISSSAEDGFFKTYSQTDFLKTFSVINDDYEDSADATKITLSVDAIMKFLPYDGFYPADRTVQLAKLFWDSYSGSFAVTGNVYSLGAARYQKLTDPVIRPQAGFINPLWKTMFAPGILYNSIKSGIAVDYPIHTASVTLSRAGVADTNDRNPLGYLEDIPRIASHFNKRLDFETLVDPEGYLLGNSIINNEPHPSASMNLTASLASSGKHNYKLAMHNFLASTTDFFSPNGQLTTIASLADNDPKFGFSHARRFKVGNEYRMRIVCSHAKYRSIKEIQNYFSSSDGSISGPIQYSASYNWNPPSLVMYARTGSDPTARSDYYGSSFGPPCSRHSYIGLHFGTQISVSDPNYSSASYEPFTPPYYDGYSHIELIYRPRHGDDTLATIMQELTHSYERYLTGFGPLDDTSDADIGPNMAYTSRMQLSSSLNLSLVSEPNIVFDALGNPVQVGGDAEGAGLKLVIQPKWETPVLNFKDVDVTLPDIGSGSVARGMWHQYGAIPKNREGIFLQVQDLDKSELDDPSLTGSLADALGFSKDPVKIGQIAQTKKISEAIVAIPYWLSPLGGSKQRFKISSDVIKQAKQIIKTRTALHAKQTNDPTPTKEVIDMVRKMKKFVIPPEFDFVTNEDIQPFAMFIFDFDVVLSQQDLANVWQNLSPDIGTSFQKKQASLPIDIFAPNDEAGTGLMGDMANPDIPASLRNLPDTTKWTVFKVKERAAYNYFAKTATTQDDEKFKSILGTEGSKKSIPDYSYNWPFDFFSLIELAKIDAKVEMTPKYKKVKKIKKVT